jgi:hypothetical protein
MSLGALFYAFINTQGVGGVFVVLIYTAAIITYIFVTRWILRGGRAKEKE